MARARVAITVHPVDVDVGHRDEDLGARGPAFEARLPEGLEAVGAGVVDPGFAAAGQRADDLQIAALRGGRQERVTATVTAVFVHVRALRPRRRRVAPRPPPAAAPRRPPCRRRTRWPAPRAWRRRGTAWRPARPGAGPRRVKSPPLSEAGAQGRHDLRPKHHAEHLRRGLLAQGRHGVLAKHHAEHLRRGLFAGAPSARDTWRHVVPAWQPGLASWPS